MQGRTGAARAPYKSFYNYVSRDCQLYFAKCLCHAKIAPVGQCGAVFGGVFFLPACSEGDVCISIWFYSKGLALN